MDARSPALFSFEIGITNVFEDSYQPIVPCDILHTGEYVKWGSTITDVVPVYYVQYLQRLIYIVPRTTGVNSRSSARTYVSPFRLAGPLSLGFAGVFALKQ